VGRQYTGSAGKVTNCQIGVFAAYVSAKGHAFVDRALYLLIKQLHNAHIPAQERNCNARLLSDRFWVETVVNRRSAC
jgi:hypothetical protein